MAKFTSEDLIKSMGLKIGDMIELNSLVWIIENRYHDIRLHAIGAEQYLKIREILDLDYEIFKPKPKLTEDEKVILKYLPKQYEYILRDKLQNLCITKKDGTFTLLPIECLFVFIKCGDNPYLIEELLKE